MKVLIVSSYLPFPLHSGGHIRLYNLIKNLSEQNEITLVCEKRDYQTYDDIKEVEKICKKVITVTRGKQWSAKNILKTGFSSKPFLIVGHENEEMKQAIKDEMVREKFDLVHVETFYVYQNLPKVSIPVVLVEHNVEHLVYQRYADKANGLIKPLLYLDVLKLKRIEQSVWRKVDRLVAVSAVERKLMKRADVDLIPNGVDTEIFKFKSAQDIPHEKRILFIGDFKWIQNVDALEFILKKIWPNLMLKLADLGKKFDIKLWVVGKNIPENLIKDNLYKNVIFDNKSKEETSQIFRKSFILLAPLRVGGGTSYKILEAMATGTAVVTTSLGVEGLEAKDKTHVLVGEESSELAKLVCDLLIDHSLYRRITLNARKYAQEKYDWKIVSNKLNEVYMSCL